MHFNPTNLWCCTQRNTQRTKRRCNLKSNFGTRLNESTRNRYQRTHKFDYVGQSHTSNGTTRVLEPRNYYA
jgi:hypothetical protein